MFSYFTIRPNQYNSYLISLLEILNPSKIIKTYCVKVDNCRLRAYQRQKELLYLYGPIVGSSALNLYNNLLVQGLCANPQSSSARQDLSFLMMIGNFNAAEFNQARRQLEAMNLLVTVAEKHSYIFYPRPPLEVELFLENVKYMRLLRSKHPKFLDHLSNNFDPNIKLNLNLRQDISVSFDHLLTSTITPVNIYWKTTFKQLDDRLIALNLAPSSYWPFKTRIEKIITFFKINPQLMFGFIHRSYQRQDSKFNFPRFEDQVNHYVLKQQKSPSSTSLTSKLMLR